MKAMVLTAPNMPFQLTDMPDPVAGEGEAVARVLSCGAGLTIQHMRAGRMKIDYPRIIGHEITAEIIEVGKGVTDVAVGDAVTSYYYLTCGTCEWCRKDRETLCDNFTGNVGRDIDGGYAEYIKLPSNSFVKLPEGLDYKAHPAEIGVITDAIATPVKLTKKTRMQPDDIVAVIGAGGGLGLQMIAVAKWAKARVIAVDVRSDKFDACRSAGADDVVDASVSVMKEAIAELTNGRGVDVVTDFVASKKTLEDGTLSLGKGGRLAILGGGGVDNSYPVSGNWIKNGEREIIGSKYATRSEVRESLEIVARGELWPIVTETFPLEEAETLHKRVEDGLVIGRGALLIGDP
jgi:propanol-preferring alcohol dehydrogenase